MTAYCGPFGDEPTLRFARCWFRYFQWLLVGHDYVFLIHYPSF